MSTPPTRSEDKMPIEQVKPVSSVQQQGQTAPHPQQQQAGAAAAKSDTTPEKKAGDSNR
jgi:hypothetical protein